MPLFVLNCCLTNVLNFDTYSITYNLLTLVLLALCLIAAWWTCIRAY